MTAATARSHGLARRNALNRITIIAVLSLEAAAASSSTFTRLSIYQDRENSPFFDRSSSSSSAAAAASIGIRVDISSKVSAAAAAA